MEDGCPGGMSMWQLERRTKERKKYRHKSVFIEDGIRIDPKTLSKEELTAKLHKAMRRENLTAIKTCIALGADCNAVAQMEYDIFIHDYRYKTPLMWAIESRRCSKRMLSDLIRRTTNLEHKNKSGFTALSLACQMGLSTKICKRLLEFGANPNINHSESCPRTPLHIAIDYSSDATVTAFLKAGAQFQFTDFINEIGEIKINENEINTLIRTPLFLPLCKDKDFPVCEKSIVHTILCLKKVCPTLPRDILYYILTCEEISRLRCLHCPFKMHAGAYDRIHQMPIQTIRRLMRGGLLDQEKTVTQLKTHCFDTLEPMLELTQNQIFQHSSDEESEKIDKQECIDLLNPENLEQLHGVAIEANIRKELARK